MKRFAILSSDYTTLANEVMSYLNSKYDVTDDEFYTHSFHLFDPIELNNTTLNSSFAGLTARAVCHTTVNSTAMFNHRCDNPIMFIPLADCESTVLKIFDTTIDAVLQTDSAYYYLDQDCILSDVMPLTAPILIREFTPFKLESSDSTKLSHALMVWFHEDPSAYLE